MCVQAGITAPLGDKVIEAGAYGSRLVADRLPDDPHRFVRAALHIDVEGDVPPDAVARAIQLSHDKYCSVWHSMRQDIEFSTSFDVKP